MKMLRTTTVTSSASTGGTTREGEGGRREEGKSLEKGKGLVSYPGNAQNMGIKLLEGGGNMW